MGAYLCIAANGVPPSISKRIELRVQCKYAKINYYGRGWNYFFFFTNSSQRYFRLNQSVFTHSYTLNFMINSRFSVPPMLTIPNQLEAAYIGQNVSLSCHTEAHPTSINYWTTERGDMIVSGTLKKLFIQFDYRAYL